MVKLNEGKIIYFPGFGKKHFLLITFALCSLFRRVFPFLIESNNFGKLQENDFNKSCLFDMMSNFLGDFLTGIYKLYLHFKDKKNKNTNKRISLIEKQIENNNELPMDEKEKPEMRNKFIKIMLTIAIVDIIAQLCLLLFSYYDKKGCSLNFPECKGSNESQRINEDDLVFTVAINIGFRYLFSRFLLTLYIYFHHKVAIIIMTISFIPLIIFNIITISQKERVTELIVYIILNVVMTILYAFEDVMNKVALNKLVIRPYDIMFYKSLFQLPFFIFIIFMVCLYDETHNSENSLGSYIDANKDRWLGRFVYRLTFIISNIFRTLSLIKVIEILTPNDLSILKSLEFVVLSSFSLSKGLIYSRKKNNQKDEDGGIIFYIMELICCIFLFFSSCIANEIFIINRCNLAKRTNYFKGYKTNKEFEDEISNIEKLKNQVDQEKDKENSKSRYNSTALFEFSDIQ